MDNFKTLVSKILAMWVGIGTALLAIGNSGILNIPAEWLELFSAGIADKFQFAFDTFFAAWGAILLAAQAVRAIFIFKDTGTGVSVKDVSYIKKIKWSPFKV